MRNILKTLALIVVVAGTTSLPVVAAAQNYSDALEIRTSDQEVWGTREVESGDYAKGIEKLKTRLNPSGVSNFQAPILINLCVAYTATHDYENATRFCNRAIDNGSNLGLAYNNRGVLHYLTGNVDASIADFEKAGELVLRYGIAKRNLARVESQSVALRQAEANY